MLNPQVSADATLHFEQIFSTGVLLSDSESLSLGVSNFDPNSVVSTRDRFEVIDNSERRNKLKVFTVPLGIELDSKQYFFNELKLKFSYVDQNEKQEFALDDSENVSQRSTDTIYTIYAGLTKNYALSERWELKTGASVYLMYHENDHQYLGSDEDRVDTGLEGLINNTYATAALFEPFAHFNYAKNKSWGHWKWQTRAGIFTGIGVTGSASAKGAEPSGWKFTNGVKYFYNLTNDNINAEQFYLKFHRIDLNGDMVSTIGTHYYYEFGLGILFNTKGRIPWLDNAGIGININQGSNLSGGSIVLYFNEL